MSVSTNGEFLVVGGPEEDGGGATNYGAVWTFHYNASSRTYYEMDAAFTGSGYTGSSLQGSSVSLSADGSIMAAGGPGDNGGIGGK